MSPSKWYGRLLRNRALTPRHELVSRLPKLNSSELNDVVHIGSINKLSATLNGHRFGPTLRRRILDTLINRISELDLSSRKKLCSSLSISHRQDRDTIVNVLTGTRGEDLDSLKDHIDSAYHRRDWNLSDLIARITVEQKGYIVEHMRLHGTSRRLTRIFSDIDDTIVCSLKDKSLPRNTVYPGAVELFSAIGRVVFLTARPRGIRRFTISKLRYTGIDLHGAGILCGSFSKLLSHAGMAEKKLSNFLDHQRIYPCTRAVILGDSGQGDILLAKEILKNTENVPPLVLIHDVVDSTFTFKTSTEEYGLCFSLTSDFLLEELSSKFREYIYSTISWRQDVLCWNMIY